MAFLAAAVYLLPARCALTDDIRAADEAADASVRSIGSIDELDRRRAEWRASWLKGIGGLPGDASDAAVRPPLEAKEGPVVECDGFTVRNVLFESLPGVYVTGHLALPSAGKSKAPYPAVLLALGHSDNGILNPRYAALFASLARAGFAVFSWDPIGQGERFQAPDGRATIRDCAEEHTSLGARGWLVGWNFARFRIWDSIRAVDYLATRPDIDLTRLGVTGTSGGGTESAYLQALEPRITAAFPNCYISSIRETFECRGCHDSEQFYHGQLIDGVNHAAMLAMGLGRVALAVGSTYRDYFPHAGSVSTFAVYSDLRAGLGVGLPCWHFHTAGPHGLPPPTRAAQLDWMRHTLFGAAVPAPLAGYHALDGGGKLKDPANGAPLPFPENAMFFTPGRSVASLPGFRSLYDVIAARAEELSRMRKRRGPLDASRLREVVRRRAGIRPLEELPDAVQEPFNHPNFDWWYLKGAYGCRRENEAAMMSVLARSVVGRDAENLIVAARREMRRNGGRPVRLSARGYDVIAAAHAYAAEPRLFSSFEFTDPPPSWTESVCSRELGRESYAVSVWGALEEYDWTDLIPAPAGTGKEKTTCR